MGAKRSLLSCLQPGKPAPGNQSYIAASYVKFVEVKALLHLNFREDMPQ